jgi:hypothetical protein
MRFLSPFLSLLLTPLMAVLPLSAQAPGALPAAPSGITGPTELHLQVIGNPTATAVVGSHLASGIVVQVSDPSGAGIPDVAVAFRLPDSGVTGVFSDGTHAAVAYTDATGRAHSGPVEWGEAPGSVAVRITAAKGTVHAGLLLQERLTAALRHPGKADPAIMSATESAPAPVVPGMQKLPAAPKPAVAQAAVGQPHVTIQSISTPRALSPAAQQTQEPSVSVIKNPAGVHSHSGKTKWLILAGVVAVGAGLGVAMGGKSGSSSSSTSNSGVSIGTPTISVGHP